MTYDVMYGAIATGPAGQVLARPLFLKAKIKFHFTKKQVVSKSARVIFGLARLVLLWYRKAVSRVGKLSTSHACNHFNPHKVVYCGN